MEARDVPEVPPSLPRRRSLAVLLLVGLLGCTTAPPDDPPTEVPPAASAPAPSPPPRSDPPVPVRPTEPELEPWRLVDWPTSGAILDFSPTLYDSDPDPFDEVLEPVEGTVLRGEPLVVTTRTFRLPAPGYRYLRTVTAVDVGRRDAAGRRIAEQLLELATSDVAASPADLEELDPEWLGGNDCSEPADETICAAARTEVVREDCEVPDGRAVRCFLVLRWVFDGWAHDFYWQDSPVFDVTSGDRLTVRDLVPGVDVDRLTLLLADAIVGLSEDVRSVDPLDMTQDLVPTAEGIWFRYDPYETGSFAQGARAIFLPYDVIALAVAPV